MSDIAKSDEPVPDPGRLTGIIAFLQQAEALKDTLRSGHTGRGRAESSAEHTWRLCLMAMLFEKELQGADMARLLKLCIVHDLGEAISGDVPAIHQTADDGRILRERLDFISLCVSLPDDLAEEMLDLWDEYSAGETPEAVLAKGLDKIETILQHVRGLNPTDFDYAFNLGYGRERTDKHPLLKAVRGLADDLTRARMARP